MRSIACQKTKNTSHDKNKFPALPVCFTESSTVAVTGIHGLNENDQPAPHISYGIGWEIPL